MKTGSGKCYEHKLRKVNRNHCSAILVGLVKEEPRQERGEGASSVFTCGKAFKTVGTAAKALS